MRNLRMLLIVVLLLGTVTVALSACGGTKTGDTSGAAVVPPEQPKEPPPAPVQPQPVVPGGGNAVVPPEPKPVEPGQPVPPAEPAAAVAALAAQLDATVLADTANAVETYGKPKMTFADVTAAVDLAKCVPCAPAVPIIQQITAQLAAAQNDSTSVLYIGGASQRRMIQNLAGAAPVAQGDVVTWIDGLIDTLDKMDLPEPPAGGAVVAPPAEPPLAVDPGVTEVVDAMKELDPADLTRIAEAVATAAADGTIEGVSADGINFDDIVKIVEPMAAECPKCVAAVGLVRTVTTVIGGAQTDTASLLYLKDAMLRKIAEDLAAGKPVPVQDVTTWFNDLPKTVAALELPEPVEPARP